MQRAVSYAQLDVIKLLVQHGAIIQDTNLLPHAVLGDIEAQTQTQNPVSEGRLDVIHYVLDHGALINAFYDDTLNADVPCGEKVMYGKMTALHFAIVGGKKHLVQLLLERGADKDVETWSAWKTRGKIVGCVELARICGFEEIADMLEAGHGV
jgi:ankyrin repeat protein